MHNDERLITYFDLSVQGRSHHKDFKKTVIEPVQNLGGLMTEFTKIVGTDLSFWKSKSTKNPHSYKLLEVKSNDDAWTILLGRVDLGAADIVTAEIDGGNQKTYELGEARGLVKSAHVVIDNVSTASGRHVVLFESGAFPFKDCVSFFNFLLKNVARENIEKYKKQYPTGENKYYNTYPYMITVGHPSKDFLEILERGIFSEITVLSDEYVPDGYDEYKHAPISGSAIKVSVDKSEVKAAGGNCNWLGRVKALGQDINYNVVKIGFKDRTEASHTVRLDSSSGNLIDDESFLAKAKISDFAVPLKTAYSNIYPPIKNAIMELLNE